MKRLSLAVLAALALGLTACEQKNTQTDPHLTEPNTPPAAMQPAPMEADPYAAPPTASPSYTPPRSTAATPAPKERVTKTTPEPQPVEPKAKSAARTYVVKKGDTLSEIAQKMYGDASQWKKIQEANRKVIKDPKKLPIGAKLVIP